MKKQIFILVMALFAIGITNSYGQLAPRPVTCLTSDALHPVAGTPYTYEIEVPTPVGAKTYNWLVTQDEQFVALGILTTAIEQTTGTILAATGVGYNNTTTGTPSISITWKSFVYNPLNPIFVVIQVENTSSGADACVTDNIKVYRIEPQNAFTLDIDNRNALMAPHTPGVAATGADYGDNLDRCIHDVVDAKYDATSPEGVLYDFGTDYLYYEVVAANWSASWRPAFKLSGVDPKETITVEIFSDEAYTTLITAMTGPANSTAITDVLDYTMTGTVPARDASGNVGGTGESIYVRVTLDHSNALLTYQGLTDEVITLAVDGITNLAAAVADQIGDIHTVAGPTAAPVCPWVDLFVNDIAQQTVKPRPTINDIDPVAPALLPVKP